MNTLTTELEELRDAMTADRDQLRMLLEWNEDKFDTESTKKITQSVKQSLSAKVQHIDELLNSVRGAENKST